MVSTGVTRLVIHGSAGSVSWSSAVSTFDLSPITAPPRPLIRAAAMSAACPWWLTAALMSLNFPVPPMSTMEAARNGVRAEDGGEGGVLLFLRQPAELAGELIDDRLDGEHDPRRTG